MFAKICHVNLLKIDIFGNVVCLNTGDFVYQLSNDNELDLIDYEFDEFRLLGNSDSHVYMQLLENAKVFQIGNGKRKALSKAKAKELIQSLETHTFNGYQYFLEDEYPWRTYCFTNINTNKKSKYKVRKGLLIAIIDGFFYFRYANPFVIEKLNEDFEIVAKKEFSSAGKTSWTSGQYFIIGETESNQSYLTVFDLVRFEEICRLACDFEKSGIISNLINIKGIDIFIYNYKLFTWDGTKLKAHFPDKVVCAIYGKEDYVYAAFENDNSLYGYSPDLSECIKSKSLPFTGFKFKSIESYQDRNFATFYSTYGEIGGMTYFAGWSDEEFFSDDPLNADIEQPLFKYTQIPDGGNFSILIELPVVKNYGTVARHALAAVTDAIYKHAVFRLDQPYSKNFNGNIELRVIDSSKLSQLEKEQLKESCLNRVERSYSLYLSPVTESSCVLNVNFA